MNADYMNAHLKFISDAAGSDTHVILILDGAGWHVAKALRVPANITLHNLPAYSPELNPVERVWAYLRGHYLSDRVFRDYDELFAETSTAWNRLNETTLASIASTQWVRRAI